MMQNNPQDYFADRVEAMLASLRRLVEIESPSGDKDGIDRVGAAVCEMAERLGAQISYDRQITAGDQVIARWNSSPKGSGILLLFHMDTVHPVGSLERNPWRIADGRIYGPGALDMKAGMVIFFEALEALRKNGEIPGTGITALFTSDEETGSVTSRGLIEALARKASLVLSMEPSLPDGSLKTWRKGVGDFEVVVRGRAAHAGADHSQGRNAIEELAHQILRIQALTDYALGTTLNVGMVQGGTARNVVPEEAMATVDLRVETPQEAERIMRELQGLKSALDGTKITVTGGLNRPPMPRSALMAETFGRAQRIASEIGLTLTEGGTGGGSDANFVAPLGIPVLDGLGGRGEGAHSDREYVTIDSMINRSALLAALLSRWEAV